MQTNVETGILTAQLVFAIMGLIVVIIALPTFINDSRLRNKSS
jgi:hypothetical protein